MMYFSFKFVFYSRALKKSRRCPFSTENFTAWLAVFQSCFPSDALRKEKDRRVRKSFSHMSSLIYLAVKVNFHPFSLPIIFRFFMENTRGFFSSHSLVRSTRATDFLFFWPWFLHSIGFPVRHKYHNAVKITIFDREFSAFSWITLGFFSSHSLVSFSIFLTLDYLLNRFSCTEIR